MGNIGSLCFPSRDNELSIHMIDRIQYLQKELVIKDITLKETERKLDDANRLLKDIPISEWRKPYDILKYAGYRDPLKNKNTSL
tara:strand:- start:1157 stop:1408 length:252 start_codon:yes stop_codon:yes gene_type:complete